MALLEPRLCVLDETDSGLDIDALKIVAEGVNRLRSPERAFVVITHYQRLLDYIVPDVVHVLSQGPHREAPAARSWRSSSKPPATPNTGTRRREVAMNVEVRPIKTAAETALATNFAMAKRALPGAPAVAALREEAFRRFESEGLPHRRVEEWKYTDLRALMRDAKPLAGAPDAAAKARARHAMARCWPRSRRAASSSSTAPSCRSSPISPTSKPASRSARWRQRWPRAIR